MSTLLVTPVKASETNQNQVSENSSSHSDGHIWSIILDPILSLFSVIWSIISGIFGYGSNSNDSDNSQELSTLAEKDIAPIALENQPSEAEVAHQAEQKKIDSWQLEFNDYNQMYKEGWTTTPVFEKGVLKSLSESKEFISQLDENSNENQASITALKDQITELEKAMTSKK